MLNKQLDKIIWLDIETIPEKESFFDLSPRKQQLFMEKFKKDIIELGLGNPSRVAVEADKGSTADELAVEADNRAKMEKLYANKAPLHPEFGAICSISFGFIKTGQIPPNIKDLLVTQELAFQTQSFYGSNEKEILEKFYIATASIIDVNLNKQWFICSHNGSSFDWPFIAKKFVIHGLSLPTYFDFSELKPWDISWFIDTKLVWRWGVYDSNTSLDLLCEIFNVPTSKDDLKGSEVRDCYYIEKNLERIRIYCEKDCLVLAQIYLKMKGIPNNLILIN